MLNVDGGAEEGENGNGGGPTENKGKTTDGKEETLGMERGTDTGKQTVKEGEAGKPTGSK